MKCFKMFGLFVASIAMIAMVGCGSSGSSHRPATSNVVVQIPLPQEQEASLRASIRAAVSSENFEAYYNDSSDGHEVKATVTGLDTDKAKCTFVGVQLGKDLHIKSRLRNNSNEEFKSYYQGVIDGRTITGGTKDGGTFDAETTAKAIVFEVKKKENENLSVATFETSLTNSGNDVWHYLGFNEEAMTNALTGLTVDEEFLEKAKENAKELEIVEPTPQPTPTPTITEKDYEKFEETEGTGALTWTPLNSLDAINRIEEGLAEVSESGQFIALNENIVLTLAAEATVQNNVRTWKVYPDENGARVAYRFIDSISTTIVTALEKQGYHAVYYYATPNEQGVYTQVGKDFSWFATETKAENFVSLDVKVTDGVADLQYTTDDGTSQSSGFTTTPLAKVNVWCANHQGSVYVKLENQTTKAARILQVASK